MDKNEITPISWFEKHGIKDYDLVMSNPWKGRQCYVFKDNTGKKFFLKWNDGREQFLRHKELLKKEECIYNILKQTNVTPKYIGNDAFITAFVEGGDTLRNTIKIQLKSGNDVFILELIKTAISKWILFRRTVEASNIHTENGSKIFCYDFYLASLITSGPIGVKWSLYLRCRNKIILELFRLSFNKKIEKILSKDAFSTIHGDFHANNIFVGDLNSVYLIDFENVQKGSPEVELAYFISQIHLLIKERSELLANVDAFVDSILPEGSKQLYEHVVKIYDRAISYNKRFM